MSLSRDTIIIALKLCLIFALYQNRFGCCSRKTCFICEPDSKEILKMTIDFYYVPASAPCRSVQLTANAVGVDLNLKYLDLFKGEHLTPEFLKLNPQHCVPTLDDNGFVLCESRAIICYLVNQYAKDDSLYPKDPKKRALVDNKLYFDATTLYQRFLDYYVPILFMGGEHDPAKFKGLENGFQLFDKLMEGRTWAAGDHITIADFALVATVSSAEIFDFDVAKYPNVTKWLANAKKTIPNYEDLNHAGCLDYRKIYDSRAEISSVYKISNVLERV